MQHIVDRSDAKPGRKRHPQMCMDQTEVSMDTQKRERPLRSLPFRLRVNQLMTMLRLVSLTSGCSLGRVSVSTPS